MSISVDVCLMNGKKASLEVELDASIDALKQRAQLALGTGQGRLLNSSGEVLDAASTPEDLQLQSGDVLTFHVKQVELVATKRSYFFSAFAAILANGSLVAWGNAQYGGRSRALRQHLKDVQQVQSSSGAFAAILSDGYRCG